MEPESPEPAPLLGNRDRVLVAPAVLVPARIVPALAKSLAGLDEEELDGEAKALVADEEDEEVEGGAGVGDVTEDLLPKYANVVHVSVRVDPHRKSLHQADQLRRQIQDQVQHCVGEEQTHAALLQVRVVNLYGLRGPVGTHHRSPLSVTQNSLLRGTHKADE